jgi:hypothetical protein
MSDCCSTSQTEKVSATEKVPSRVACPVCDQAAAKVGLVTLLHNIKSPWLKQIADQSYYFCESADCQVVYFGLDGVKYTLDQIRIPPGQKQTDSDKVLCYCFDVKLYDYQQQPAIKDFVVEQTKLSRCACDSRNPSGRCCLKDFPK